MVEKKKILLVEDDAFISSIYQTKLESEGFTALVAENGIEAIKILEKTSPDLILLDVIMPYMDGLEVLRNVKKDDRWKKIPIILLTNLSEKDKIEEALGIGADDYLLKSHFTPTEVIEKVNSLLKR